MPFRAEAQPRIVYIDWSIARLTPRSQTIVQCSSTCEIRAWF